MKYFKNNVLSKNEINQENKINKTLGMLIYTMGLRQFTYEIDGKQEKYLTGVRVKKPIFGRFRGASAPYTHASNYLN